MFSLNSSSVGIIGGADGPTAIIVSDPNGILPIITYGLAAIAAVIVAGIVFFIVNKRKKGK